MSSIGNLAKDLYTIMHNADEKGPKPYEPVATVVKNDEKNDDVLWVKLPGGNSETPVEKTVDAKPGDKVRIRVSGGRAWVIGNASNPPTDDTTAKAAYNKAVVASDDAARAKTAADQAEQEAIRAYEAADRAEAEAERAYGEAERATGYANDALTQLSTVEDVVDTLNWITEHGTMTLTTDTEIDPTHVYFVRDDNGDYVVGNYHYRLVTEPKTSELNTYYVLSIDEAVSNYVASHLALTDEGLYVVKDNQGYKVLLANDGLKIYDNGGHLVSTFGENITFDAERPQRIGNDTTYVKFYDSNNDRVADKIEISGDVNIANTVSIGGYQQSDYLNSNVEIGGRNLFKQTPKYHNATAYLAYQLNLTENMVENGTYTLQLWGVVLDSNSEGIRPYWGGGHISLSSTNLFPDANGYIIYTFSIDSTQASHADSANAWINIYNYQNTHAGMNMEMSKWKLEKGNKATDWTPAPEDTDSAIAAAQSTAEGANAQEQIIYKQAVSGTNTMSGTDTWVTATSESVTTGTPPNSATGLTPIWTTKRPSYQKNYPVLFVATQRKTVAGEVTCTTPLKDDTTTIIDGGHITTGTIDASKATITNINGQNITAGDIAADRMKTYSITAINSLTTGQINAARLQVGSISVGDLSDGSNYSTTTQMNGAIGKAVDNIDVGGRNILVGTATSISKATTTTSGYVTQSLYYTPFKKTLSELGYKVGDEITLSFDWKITSATTYGNARIEWYGYKDASNIDTYLAALINPFATFSSSNTSGHVETTATLTSTTVNTKRLVMRIDNSSLTLTISNLKLEKGNKATVWSQAPEDESGTNLLSYPYFRDVLSGSPYTANGITFTLNKDGTVTVKGTATATTWYQFTSSLYPNSPNGAFCLPAGTYTISGCPSGGSSSTYRLAFTAYSPSDGTTNLGTGTIDYGKGATTTLTQSALMRIEIGIYNGTVCPSEGLTFKPMVEVGTIAHPFSTPASSEAASQSATKYITRINDAGIFISPSDQSPTTSAAGNSVKINGDGLNVYKEGNSVAFYGDTARVGKENTQHVSIDPNGVGFYDGSMREVSIKGVSVGTVKNGHVDFAPDDVGNGNCYISGGYGEAGGNDIITLEMNARAAGQNEAYVRVFSSEEGGGVSRVTVAPELRVYHGGNSYPVINREYICYANSRVDNFVDGQITLSLSTFGITTGQKPVGILITYQDGGATPTILRYDYDASSSSGVVIKAYNSSGSAVSGNVRYFAVVFQNSWTSAT